MNKNQKKLLDKIGLAEADFKPKENTIEAELADLAQYVEVLTEMVLGGASDGN